jgi:hypothetical protein
MILQTIDVYKLCVEILNIFSAATDLSKMGKRITITDAAAMAMSMTSKTKKHKGILRKPADFENRDSTQMVSTYIIIFHMPSNRKNATLVRASW